MKQDFKDIYNEDALINGAKHETKGERYRALSTIDFANTLETKGLKLVHSKVSKAKISSNQAFQTNITRYKTDISIGSDLGLDIILKNSGLYGSIKAYLGVFRGLCSNQLTVGASYGYVSIRHDSDVYAETDRAIEQLLSQRETLIESIYTMKNRILSQDEMFELHASLIDQKLGTTHFGTVFTREDKQYSVSFRGLYRHQDSSPDLWTQFNLAQERIVKGDLITTDLDTGERTKVRRMDPARAATIELNKELWQTAIKLVA